MRAKSTFELKSWDEKPIDGVDNPKVTRAHVTEVWRGEIEAEVAVEYVMAYVPDGSASFVNVNRVVGRLGERAGSFVVQGSGTYDATTGIARGTWKTVAGAATEDFATLRAEGTFMSQRAPGGTIELDYEFD